MKKNYQQGFTLIELLVVIAIIAILAVVVFVALDPVTRFADARNSRRHVDVANILTGVHEYIVDNGGSYPTGLSAGMSEVELGTCGAGAANCAGVSNCVDLSTPLAAYLKTMPLDPDSANGTAAATGYTVEVDSNGIVTIDACHAENAETIQTSR